MNKLIIFHPAPPVLVTYGLENVKASGGWIMIHAYGACASRRGTTEICFSPARRLRSRRRSR